MSCFFARKPFLYRRLVVVVLTLMLFAVVERCKSSASELPQIGAGKLDWVPAQVETVVITRGPFRVPEEYALSSGGSNLSIPHLCRGTCFGPLAPISNCWFYGLIKNSSLLLSVEYRLNFGKRSPHLDNRCQVDPYDDATILLFEGTDNAKWVRMISAIGARSHRKMNVGNYVVYQLDFDSSQYPIPEFYFCSPCNGFLIYASRLDLLSEVIAKVSIGKLNEVRTKPDSILGNEDWLAIRRYVQGSNDPTSPLSNMSAWRDPQAKGFVLTILSKDKVAWTYYSDRVNSATDFRAINKLIVNALPGNRCKKYVLFDKDAAAYLYFTVESLLGPSFSL